MLFNIIFWTNLLTQSLVPVPVFSLFLSFTEKEYQAESKWNKIFAMIFLDQKTPVGLGEGAEGVLRGPQAC